MGLPRYSTLRKLPRDFPYQPEPVGWVRYLAWESSDNDSLAKWKGDIPFAVGRGKQNTHPGIVPCNREMMKTDKYKHLRTFKIRCGSSGHETTVHNWVVLEQSEWLRDKLAGQEDPDAPVLIPSHIKWWQVAWVLEYMYEGRVPGFHLLAGEDWPERFPRRQPRSIAWGLLELWEAAHFFGLDGLKKRAEAAFAAYFCTTIRLSITLHRAAIAHGGLEDTAPDFKSTLAWPEARVAHEFCQAVWRIFGDPYRLPNDYYGANMTDQGWHRYTFRQGPIAEDEPAIRAWESAMFDKTGAPDDGVGALERPEPLYQGPMPQYPDVFRSRMIHLSIWCAKFGLFELKWFQEFMTNGTLMRCPVKFRDALARRMEELVNEWPSDEYPRAPFSFERVDPRRSTAPNAMPIPVVPLSNERELPVPLMPQAGDQEAPAVEQQ